MAWVCSHRLFAILRSTAAPTRWLRDTFSEAVEQISPDSVDRRPDYWFDVAHPRNVRALQLLVAGISYALAEDSGEVLDQDLREMLAKRTFLERENMRFPAPDLLRDNSRAHDGLQSFLGGDRGLALSPLLGEQDAGYFSRAALEYAAQVAADKLIDPEQMAGAWTQLYVVLGDLPPSDALADSLRSRIRLINFVELVEKDLDLGAGGLLIATLQAVHLADQDLREHLKDQLVRVATFLADNRATEQDLVVGRDDLKTSSKVLSFRLVESILNLCIDPMRPAGDAITQFAELVTKLAEELPSAIPVLRPIIQRLCEDLPLSLTHSLWPLLVRLRSE